MRPAEPRFSGGETYAKQTKLEYYFELYPKLRMMASYEPYISLTASDTGLSKEDVRNYAAATPGRTLDRETENVIGKNVPRMYKGTAGKTAYAAGVIMPDILLTLLTGASDAVPLDSPAGDDDIMGTEDAFAEGAGDSFYGKIYTPVDYKGTVKVNGEIKDVSRRVYQRNDIDINYFDETTGLTNLERMQAGKPPIGVDGSPLELHHVLQQEAGPMAELREITHQQYYSQLHGLVENGASFRNNPLLNKQYNNFRYNYWKWRAGLAGGK